MQRQPRSEIVDSIHREIDGENSPEESARLRALLGSDADAAREFSLLSIVDQSLSRVQLAEPPEALKQRVLDALPAPPRRHALAFLNDFLESLRPRPALAYAYVLATGIILGIGGYALISGGGGLGTARPHATLLAQPLLGDGRLAVPGLSGTIEAFAGADLVTVNVSFDASEPAIILLTPEPAAALRSLSREGTAFPEVAGGSIHAHVSGRGAVVATFERNEAGPLSLSVEIHRGSRSLYEETLTLLPSGSR